MNPNLRLTPTILVGVAGSMLASGYLVGSALADGVPTQSDELLYYSGELDENSSPYTGTKDIEVSLWDVASGGAVPLCATTVPETPVTAGHFRVALADACVQAIHDNPDTWVQVAVDGTNLGRSKVGAVPYALEAARASAAAGELEQQLAMLQAKMDALEAEDCVTSADLSTELQGYLPTSTAPPATPGEGQVWLDSSSGALKVYDEDDGRWAPLCPSDMVPVGNSCVDKYEASVWARKDGEAVDCAMLQDAVNEALAAEWTDEQLYDGFKTADCGADALPMCDYKQYGSAPGCDETDACDDFPTDDLSGFPDSGHWTAPLYACSIRDVFPSRSLTWFQAQQACSQSGKRLISNGEWQLAVAGTHDPGAHDGADGSCLTTGGLPRRTGLAAASCRSQYGVEDLIGNLDEWVDQWGQAGPTTADFQPDEGRYPWPAGYAQEDGDSTQDATANVNGSSHSKANGVVSGMPFASRRGGDFSANVHAGAFHWLAGTGPSFWSRGIGFRCSKSL